MCLLVLLGAVLAFGSPRWHVPADMIQTHESIAQLLGLKQPEIGTKPLFSSVIRSINTSCQRKEDIMLINATLSIYTRIFSSILQHGHDHHNSQHHDKASALLDQLSDSEKTRVKTVVKTFQQEMEKLKRNLGQVDTDKEDVLSELNKIKVDDPIDQRKALAEYQQIYQAASVISSQS
ncbi:interferon gamma 1-like isoform X2 [Trachinotus anak]|uniref:interferon gamma 1-like isoform X2 n=1 Tax=Trachinotus anak TaxID=443729 RepID=UPI0039F1B7A3